MTRADFICLAIIFLGGLVIMEIADNALARQDRIMQEEWG